MEHKSYIKWLGILPMFLYILATSIWSISWEIKIYLVAFVIFIGLLALFLRRKELTAKGKRPFLVIVVFLVVTILIFYFQYKS